MTMNAQVMYMMMMEVAWQYISECYGNAMIGRYGGYFEEDIRRFMCDKAYHVTGFGCTGKVCTNSRGEKGQCTKPNRIANCGKVGVLLIH